MANEITTFCSLSVNNGTLILPQVGTVVQITQATARGGGPGVVDVGLSPETIGFGDIVPGYVYAKNLDATNYVQLGVDYSGVFVPMLQLKAGEQSLFRLDAGVTTKAMANTAAVKVLFSAVNT
jgi:hypothetical protein